MTPPFVLGDWTPGHRIQSDEIRIILDRLSLTDMSSKNRELKDYSYTGGAPGHYEAGVMFFREHGGAIRRCVVQVDELHGLTNNRNARDPKAFELVYKNFRERIHAAADDQLLHGDSRDTVIVEKVFLNLF